MRIGIDAHYLGHSQSGNETYVRGLIGALARVDGAHDYTVYVSSRAVVADPPVVGENIRYRFVRSSPLARVVAGLPLELVRHPVDLLQAHYNAPLVVPTRLLLVMHDISWATMPHLFPALHGTQIALRARPAVRKAGRIVVASNAMKDEVSRYYAVPEDRIDVVPLGVSERFRAGDRAAALERVREKFGTGDSFVLNVGDLQPRKNLARLIEAFSALVREGRETRLVIAGKKAWGFDDVFETIERLDLGHAVVLTGYVGDDDLVDLYNAAELFVYPSIYEGFGLPPLEAMACGTPVVASDEPTLRETTGAAALAVDPNDVESIADGMRRGLDDAAWRERARTTGLERAASLSWDRCARRMLEIYAEVGSG
ncbi:MAG TPA: glycosyltransferase family 1 protein [Coriobacteriia bacterium]